jgi:hypothetical protein
MQHNHCIDLYTAHRFCWGQDAGLVVLHSVSDAVVALAYFAIPISLFYLARKYRIKRLSSVFFVYGLFILLCGTTHVFDVVTVWKANYWVYLADGLVRALTAVVSVAAAWVTVRCAKDAVMGFTRLAAYERKMGERLQFLKAKGEEHTEWVRTLTEMREAVNRVRAYAEPEG